MATQQLSNFDNVCQLSNFDNGRCTSLDTSQVTTLVCKVICGRGCGCGNEDGCSRSQGRGYGRGRGRGRDKWRGKVEVEAKEVGEALAMVVAAAEAVVMVAFVDVPSVLKSQPEISTPVSVIHPSIAGDERVTR